MEYIKSKDTINSTSELVDSIVELTQRVVGSENFSVSGWEKITILGETFGVLGLNSIIGICQDILSVLSFGIYGNSYDLGQEEVLRNTLKSLMVMQAIGSTSYQFGREIKRHIYLTYDDDDYLTLGELREVMEENNIDNSVFYNLTATKKAIDAYAQNRDNQQRINTSITNNNR